MKRIDSTRNEGYLDYLTKKYPLSRTSPPWEHFTFVRDLAGLAGPARDCDLLLFVNNDQAGRFYLDRQNEAGCFRGPALIGLAWNPNFFHHSITTCTFDWERLGYIMAHTLIGDVKFARSRQGYLHIECEIIERDSTLLPDSSSADASVI